MKSIWIVCLILTVFTIHVACSELNDLEMPFINEINYPEYKEEYQNSFLTNSTYLRTVMTETFLPRLAWSSFFAMSLYVILSILSSYEGRMIVFVGLGAYCLMSIVTVFVLVGLDRAGMIPSYEQSRE